MSNLIMSDASVIAVQVVSVSGSTTEANDVTNTAAKRSSVTGKHTFPSADPYSKDRHLMSFVRKRVDSVTNKQIESGVNLTCWGSNHPSVTAVDRYDGVHALFCAIYGVSAAMDAGTKARLDKYFAGGNLFS